jgi:transcriptional regulator with XRE-family HTH domain
MRQDRGITQADLAEAAGVTQRMISAYEVENAQPPLSVLPALARALGISVDSLVDGVPPEPRRRSKPKPDRSKTRGRRTASTAVGNGELESFGGRLAQLRVVRGMTQRDLAAAAGISNRMVAYYEAQRGNPPATLLLKFARILGVSTDDLLGHRPSSDRRTAPTTRLWRRFQRLERLPESKRRALLRLIDEMLGEVSEQG